VLFGGLAGVQSFNDTWIWDGKAWSTRSGAAPAARHDASLVYDPAVQQLLLTGGLGGSTGTGNTAGQTANSWTWDGRSWKQSGGASPPASDQFGNPTGNFPVVYDAATRTVVLYLDVMRDTWTW